LRAPRWSDLASPDILKGWRAQFPSPRREILGARDYDERTFQRRGVSGISADEEASVQRLLEFLPKQQPPGFELPARFDARSADSRIALLGLASLKPRDTTTGRELDISEVIENDSIEASRRVVGDGVGASSPANRVILPGRGLARDELLRSVECDQATRFPQLCEQILRSHAISRPCVEALGSGDHAEFIAERKRTLERQIAELGARMAEWSSNDRPSIEYLLAQVDSEHGATV
jgi:hypothetical protein